LPALIEAVKRQTSADRKAAFQDRGARLASAHQKAVEEARTEASYAWDASPVSVARLCAELWDGIRDEDWSLVAFIFSLSNWPLRLWNFEKHYQFIGGSGGGGSGYNAPAATGAALANRKHRRLTVSIQ
jgi:acetolactate synthase I/II/III large subunit